MKVVRSRIVGNELIASRIYKLSVKFEGEIKPGQFFMLKTLDNSFLLPRPISVFDYNEGIVTFIYRTGGQGTTSISKMKSGAELQLFGPLGNGFNLNDLHGEIAVIGGGIGIAPLLYLTKKIGKSAHVFLGFKDFIYCDEEFKRYTDKVTIVTEDGSHGEMGFVTDHVDFSRYDAVVACGPEIMMNKITNSCKNYNVKCFVSLERRMACGMGVCLGCTVITKDGYKRACKDGPVFSGDELL
jgi:dihydroorotate dehydrogenase electron transfer subunit